MLAISASHPQPMKFIQTPKLEVFYVYVSMWMNPKTMLMWDCTKNAHISRHTRYQTMHHLSKNLSCLSPPVAGWNLYALERYSSHVNGRYFCGCSSVISSWGASTVALKGGFKKQASDNRFDVPFTAALCNTLLYRILLNTCATPKNTHIRKNSQKCYLIFLKRNLNQSSHTKKIVFMFLHTPQKYLCFT